ncbi:GroES-like protein [Backusella circina FSU 941]|nr:GroES-like protein [Backusella circina FSU 941]
MSAEKITIYPTTTVFGKFKEEAVEVPNFGDHDILVKMIACGEKVLFGHEPIGRVVRVGTQVKRLQIGDIIGTSFSRNACLDCPECNSGADNMCHNRIMFPGKDVLKYNGFADHMVADNRLSYKIPEKIEPKYSGPLMCAGVTVFNAIYSSSVLPSSRIAVVGIGGLGHLALQFARAWGCHVTAISHSPDKKEEALGFGAHDFLVSKDFSPESISKMKKHDLVIDTVSANLEWDVYLSLVKRNGSFTVIGFPGNPIEIKNVPVFIIEQKKFRGSIVGG